MERQEEVKELREDLKKLKGGSYGSCHTVKTVAENIRIIVKSGISWGEFGINEKELKELVLKVQKENAERELEILKEGSYGFPHTNDEIETRANREIRQAVEDSAISWEKLGIDEKDFKELILEMQKKNTRRELAVMRKGLYIDSLVRSTVEEIREAVENGTMSWEELGTDEKELEELKELVKRKSF